MGNSCSPGVRLRTMGRMGGGAEGKGVGFFKEGSIEGLFFCKLVVKVVRSIESNRARLSWAVVSAPAPRRISAFHFPHFATLAIDNVITIQPPLKNKHSDTITFEHIAKFPRRAEIGCQGVPTMISFSPDNKDIVFLWNKKGGLTQSLYRMEIATKTITILFDAEKGDEKKKYTEEEKLRREVPELKH
eukprot:jgi/Bigna1/77514/fgenesh1_pg.48_\